ncbi:TonB-dependent receptor plug domain-containing protein, partial [Aliarcobacter butzleri]
NTATTTTTSLKEIPNSVQVINNEIIDAQKAHSVSEVLHNSSGVVSYNPLATSVWESNLIRGFAVEQLQDGNSLNY